MVSIMVRAVVILMLLAPVSLVQAAGETATISESTDSSAGARNTKVKSLAAETFDSPAQTAMKKLALPVMQEQERPHRVEGAERSHPDLVTRLEEIRVYGRNEPEDYVGPKVSPLMQLRSRLEREITLSPAKKVQLAFCLIGLCGIYGPEGIPLGDSPERRAEDRLVQSTVQLNAQFRGTLQ